MTALVVVDVSEAFDETSARLDIFPGGPTPSVFQARTPFWIGYGFAPDPGARVREAVDEEATTFELEVDGSPIEMQTELTYDGESPLRKTVSAFFPSGLPVGWHELCGRWYDRGRLLFASRAAVEFVER